MNTSTLYQVEQLTLDFDLDRPQFSICPKCSSDIIKLADGCGVCGWSQEEKLQGDKLSIPCLIKQPSKEPVEGIIIGDLGSQFKVQINDQVITIAKIYVFPHFPSPKKCRTDHDLSPCKKSRRKRGEGSGDIEYRPVKRGLKTYQQLYYHYEIWQSGDRLVKSSKYIPKKLEAKVIRMNQEKESVEKILKVLNSKSKRRKK